MAWSMEALSGLFVQQAESPTENVCWRERHRELQGDAKAVEALL